MEQDDIDFDSINIENYQSKSVDNLMVIHRLKQKIFGIFRSHYSKIFNELVIFDCMLGRVNIKLVYP